VLRHTCKQNTVAFHQLATKLVKSLQEDGLKLSGPDFEGLTRPRAELLDYFMDDFIDEFEDSECDTDDNQLDEQIAFLWEDAFAKSAVDRENARQMLARVAQASADQSTKAMVKAVEKHTQLIRHDLLQSPPLPLAELYPLAAVLGSIMLLPGCAEMLDDVFDGLVLEVMPDLVAKQLKKLKLPKPDVSIYGLTQVQRASDGQFFPSMASLPLWDDESDDDDDFQDIRKASGYPQQHVQDPLSSCSTAASESQLSVNSRSAIKKGTFCSSASY